MKTCFIWKVDKQENICLTLKVPLKDIFFKILFKAVELCSSSAAIPMHMTFTLKMWKVFVVVVVQMQHYQQAEFLIDRKVSYLCYRLVI